MWRLQNLTPYAIANVEAQVKVEETQSCQWMHAPIELNLTDLEGPGYIKLIYKTLFGFLKASLWIDVSCVGYIPFKTKCDLVMYPKPTYNKRKKNRLEVRKEVFKKCDLVMYPKGHLKKEKKKARFTFCIIPPLRLIVCTFMCFITYGGTKGRLSKMCDLVMYPKGHLQKTKKQTNKNKNQKNTITYNTVTVR